MECRYLDALDLCEKETILSVTDSWEPREFEADDVLRITSCLSFKGVTSGKWHDRIFYLINEKMAKMVFDYDSLLELLSPIGVMEMDDRYMGEWSRLALLSLSLSQKSEAVIIGLDSFDRIKGLMKGAESVAEQ